MKKTLLHGAVWGTVAVFLSKVMGFLYIIPLNRFLNPAELNVFQYSYRLYAYIVLIATAGVPFATALMISRYNAKHNYVIGLKLLRSNILVMFSIGVMSAVLLSMLAYPLASSAYPIGANSIEEHTKRIDAIVLGLRATPSNHDFIIEESVSNTNFFNVIGIESPGFASAPAIAKYVSQIAKFEQHDLKHDFKEYVPTTLINHLSLEERSSLIAQNPDYGKIICRCEKVSLEEIRQASRGNVKALNIKGVKKRCRPGSGVCQGGFCEPEVLKVLAQEQNIPMDKVCYDDNQSYVLKGKSKGEID